MLASIPTKGFHDLSSKLLNKVPKILHYRFSNGTYNPPEIRLPVGAKVPFRPNLLEYDRKGQPTGAWTQSALDAFEERFKAFGMTWSHVPTHIKTSSGKTPLVVPASSQAQPPSAPVVEKLREHLDARMRKTLGAENDYIHANPMNFHDSSAMYPHTDGIASQHWHHSLGTALYYPKQAQGGHLFLRPRQIGHQNRHYIEDSPPIYGYPVKDSPEFLIPNVTKAFTLSTFSQEHWLHRGSLRSMIKTKQGQALPKHHFASIGFSKDV